MKDVRVNLRGDTSSSLRTEADWGLLTEGGTSSSVLRITHGNRVHAAPKTDCSVFVGGSCLSFSWISQPRCLRHVGGIEHPEETFKGANIVITQDELELWLDFLKLQWCSSVAMCGYLWCMLQHQGLKFAQQFNWCQTQLPCATCRNPIIRTRTCTRPLAGFLNKISQALNYVYLS